MKTKPLTMKKMPLFIFCLLLSTSIFSQSTEAKCNSFYTEYGIHLITFGDKEKGLVYLLKSEIPDDTKYKYAKIVETAIVLNKSLEFIFDYMYKLCFAIGEDVYLDDILEYPRIKEYIKEKGYEDIIYVLCEKARIDVRNKLNFTFYNKIKNSHYIDQNIIRLRKTRFTDDIDWLIKMDTLNIESLAAFFKQNTLPEKGDFTLGSTKDRFFILLLHNSRYPYKKTYHTVTTLAKQLVELGYLNHHSLLLFHDEHLVNQDKKQTYGKAMARWEGDDKIVFPPIEHIEKLDSIRVSDGILPFQFEMQAIALRNQKRTVIPPKGYVFDENWKQYCDCALLE